jgi:twitching motility protein PilU
MAAVEIMLNSPLISDLIFKGEVGEIKEIMKKSASWACRPSTRLFELYEGNTITYEDALRNADSVNDLRLQIKLNSQPPRLPMWRVNCQSQPRPMACSLSMPLCRAGRPGRRTAC